MYQKGSVVKSTSGRDQGRFYVVLRLEGNGGMGKTSSRAWIADGKVRKLASPKCKNLKHLSPTNTVLDCAQLVSDRQLRHLLSPFNTP